MLKRQNYGFMPSGKRERTNRQDRSGLENEITIYRDDLVRRLLAHRKKFRGFAKLPDTHQRLIDLRLLVAEEKKLGDGIEQPIAFHNVLLKSSFVYNQIWHLAEMLNLKTAPAFKSWIHMIREFDPFNKTVEYSRLTDEIYWTINRPDIEAAAQDQPKILRYNWSAFHEACHLNFFNVMPCSDPKLLTFYFIFIEAFVTIQESILALELGPELQAAFVAVGVLNHAPIHQYGSRQTPPADFAKMIYEYHFDRLIKVIDAKGKTKWEPKYWVTEFWTGHNRFKTYSKKLLNEDVRPLKRFELKTFDPDTYTAHPAILTNFSRWYMDLIHA